MEVTLPETTRLFPFLNQWNELRRGRTGLAVSYQVKGIPHYVLIAPSGKIQDMWSGYGSGSLLEKVKKNLK